MNTTRYFEALFGTLGAFLSFFLGGLDGILRILVIVMIVDYITGVLNSFVQKSFSPAISVFTALLAKSVCSSLLALLMSLTTNFLLILKFCAMLSACSTSLTKAYPLWRMLSLWAFLSRRNSKNAFYRGAMPIHFPKMILKTLTSNSS